MTRGPQPSELSIHDLTAQVGRDLTTLARGELLLARMRLVRAARGLIWAIALLAVAAICGLVVIGALTATVILALAIVLPAWLAALIVAAIALVAAAGLGAGGAVLVRRSGARATGEMVESVKEDLAWIRTRSKSGERSMQPAGDSR